MQPSSKILGLAKLYVCLVAFLTLAQSSTDRLAEPGLALSAVMTIFLVSFGLMDAIVNDLLPSKYTAPTAFRWKYLVFIGLSVWQLSLAYEAVISYRVDFHVLRYALDAAAAVVVAVSDFKARWTVPNGREVPHSSA